MGNDNLKKIESLSCQAAAKIISTKDAWLSCLNTVSRLYKYPFSDQLLIHAQRPNATACATMGIWNKNMHRWVKSGSKGIALIDRSQEQGRLAYVFDVSDTIESANSVTLNLWALSSKRQSALLGTLQESYGLLGSDLMAQLKGIAMLTAEEYLKNDDIKLIQYLRDNRFAEAPVTEINKSVKNALSASIYHCLLSRCHIADDGYFTEEIFQAVKLFDTYEGIIALGTVISRSAEHVLRQIEKIITSQERMERSHNHGDQLHSSGRVSVSQFNAGGQPDAAGRRNLDGADKSTPDDRGSGTIYRQIRMDEGKLSERTQPDSLQRIEDGRSIDATPVGSTGNSDQSLGFDSGRAGEEESRAGQGIRSDGLGQPYERAEGNGGRNNKERDHLQLAHSPGINYRITDDNLGVGGAKTKYRNNIEAIRVLQKIEKAQRRATSEEQVILSKYIGWGGLPQAFDNENDSWIKEYAELKSLLTINEYEMAKASTLNAHYTAPMVIKAIYEAVERMGFTSGNILEPACGNGNFFGLIPESMSDAKLYGVELDSISGRIATQLYQNANITVSAYEKAQLQDNFFDLAIGNVPFGNYGIDDPKYNKHNFFIHDYFFAKTLDKVRPGGIVAFITSKGTLDKQNPKVRKYIAQRADLLGAVRLPNNAFLANAGTEVTTDIIYLQKRERIIDIEPDWVHLGTTVEGIPVNGYFAEHPEMILGQMIKDKSMYGNQSDTSCVPLEGADLSNQLKEALKHIEASSMIHDKSEMNPPDGSSGLTFPADPSVRNYSYTIVNDRVLFRKDSTMHEVNLPEAALNRIRDMIGLRDCVNSLIDLQLNESSDTDIKNKQHELNSLHDRFIDKYGLINSRSSKTAFSEDSSYYLLCSLEILDEDGALARKADIFTKRTIKQKVTVQSVDTASEALALSIAEKACVDISYMCELASMSKDKLLFNLQGVIFANPEKTDQLGNSTYETADQYLSGNVRKKLQLARTYAEKEPDVFYINVAALEAVQPKDLTAGEIDLRLGTTWIDKEYIESFVFELLQPPFYIKTSISVDYEPHTATWNVHGKNFDKSSNIFANVTYGTSRMNAYQIIEDTLNLKDVRVYDIIKDSSGEKRILNKKETMLAQQKQEAIKQAFKDWIFTDPTRREHLTQKYNAAFNSTRPREYDGSHINFVGINPEIKLFSHQRNAIAHILYGKNTLLAHEVGAGKSFEMIAAAMESKRLGLSQKSLFVVPNHIIEQMASEFMRLYPSANILVASKTDFEPQNRKKFCARIATGEYDAVIIGHSQFEKIPVSHERQVRLISEQIAEITGSINAIKNSKGKAFTVKQLEKTKKQLNTKLSKLTNEDRKDDVVTFEQLGVDRLFIDEAHNFKNLFYYTKMHNVAGISQTEAQKSSDLFMKCRYIDEITNGKGIVFATGTPVSNSMTELYTMMRYLQFDTLLKNDLSNFDAWASTFGETVTAVELAPEGTGYRAKTRFAKFYNLPELMCMFKECADIKTADMLNLPTPISNLHMVAVKPSEHQKELVSALSKRAAAIHNGLVDSSDDNMLLITSDGRKIGLDQRLINPLLPDDPNSKVNTCTDNVFRIWEDTKADNLTQLVFCDISTPHNDDRFNVYDDIRYKLISRGIPEKEIVFIHDADTDAKKKELFAKVRKGQVRILFGSTAKMGAGTNVQDKLIAVHDLDCPWRPADLEQRRGRIVRQGNQNSEVHIYRYVTESTFDAYLYQTVENKQKFIGQIMSSKNPVRSCDDVDDAALSYAEIKALCAGNPLIREKMGLDIDVSKLKLMKSNYLSTRYDLEDRLSKQYPASIQACKESISAYEHDLQLLSLTADRRTHFPPMTINGQAYTKKEDAGQALLDTCIDMLFAKNEHIGSYAGFDMFLSFDSAEHEFQIALKNESGRDVTLGADALGNITRINNALDGIQDDLEGFRNRLENLYFQVDNAKKELEKPFLNEDELQKKTSRLTELDILLNMDEQIKEQNDGDIIDVGSVSIDRATVESSDKPLSMEAHFKAAKDKSEILNIGKKDNPKEKVVGIFSVKF